jgi:prepilin-type N-terminal cleavage/methylation domain-containing protein
MEQYRFFFFYNRMKKLSQNNGFTLGEALISLVILGIILSGGMGFYFNSGEVMIKAMDKKIAIEMANQVFEQMKDAGYVGLPPSSSTWEAVSAVTFGDFSGETRRRITDVEVSSPNTKKVELQVCWPACGVAGAKTLDFVTYVAP